MSRIDVVKSGKKGATVLVNMGCLGSFSYSSPALANKEAKDLHDKHYPHASLNLLQV